MPLSVPQTIPLQEEATMHWSVGAENLFNANTIDLSDTAIAKLVLDIEAIAFQFFKDEPKDDQIVIMRFVRDALINFYEKALGNVQVRK